VTWDTCPPTVRFSGAAQVGLQPSVVTLLFLGQLRNKKFHRSWPKLAQVENTKSPAVVATPFDRPIRKFLFGFHSTCIDDVSHIPISDHPAALLAPRSPIHCVCHLNPRNSELLE
jgi:hypothetical protein